MILSVCNENVSFAVHRDAFKTLGFYVIQTRSNVKTIKKNYMICHLELPVALTPAAKRPEESSVRVEDLDPVVAGVRHKDEPSFVYCHTPVKRKWLTNNLKLWWTLVD